MRRLVVVASAVAVLALSGCGNDAAPETPGGGAGTDPATSTGPEPTPDGGGSGSGCAVISAEQVSAILGEAYVETPTGIEGAGPDGAYTEDGVSGFACLFSPADGDVHDLSITTFTNSSGMYDLMTEDEPGTAVDGVGVRAQLFRDDIEVGILAEGADHTVAMVVLTNLDGSPVEDQVAEITRIVLGG